MSEINNERNSAPTGAIEEVNEMNLDAEDPLGDATCSASDSRLKALAAVELVNKMRDKYNEAEKHPKDSDEYTTLFNEGKEYLRQLTAL